MIDSAIVPAPPRVFRFGRAPANPACASTNASARPRRREIAYGPSPCLSLSGTDAFGTTAGARPGYAGSAASIGLAHVGDLRARRLLNGMTSLSWNSVLKYLLTEVKPPRSQGDLRVQRVDWSAVSVGWAAGLGAA
jgi:hypothetical protein